MAAFVKAPERHFSGSSGRHVAVVSVRRAAPPPLVARPAACAGMEESDPQCRKENWSTLMRQRPRRWPRRAWSGGIACALLATSELVMPSSRGSRRVRLRLRVAASA